MLLSQYLFCVTNIFARHGRALFNKNRLSRNAFFQNVLTGYRRVGNRCASAVAAG